MEAWIVILAVVALLALFLVTTYNRLVTLRQRVREAWSDIDVQLKRRHDLIPNVVETVKGYAGHERATLESVTQARAQLQSARGPGAAAEANSALNPAPRTPV